MRTMGRREGTIGSRRLYTCPSTVMIKVMMITMMINLGPSLNGRADIFLEPKTKAPTLLEVLDPVLMPSGGKPFGYG